MHWQVIVLLSFTAALLSGMLLLQEIGYRLGRRYIAIEPDAAHSGVGVIQAAVFALLGLLLAFQFSGAAARLETRRHFGIEEANAIGTAYLRLDLLPAEEAAPLRELMRQYVDSRNHTWQLLPDVEAAQAEYKVSQDLQTKIWSTAAAACGRQSSMAPTMLLLPALNQMIDITTSRTVVGLTHSPWLIFGFLVCVLALSALMAGYAMSAVTHRNLLHMFLFAFVTAITMYAILDLEFPRFGLIQIGLADDAMLQVREMMK